MAVVDHETVKTLDPKSADVREEILKVCEPVAAIVHGGQHGASRQGSGRPPP